MIGLLNKSAFGRPPTKWDPAKKSSRITLSSDGFTATHDGSANYGGALATKWRSSSAGGKWYFEIAHTPAAGGSNIVPGYAKDTVNHDNFLYANTSIGQGHQSAVETAAIRWGVSIDMTLAQPLVEIYRANVLYSSKAFVGFTAGTLYPGVTLYSGGAAVIKPIAALFLYSPPTGFLAWG
jgi:hypothetical protein